MGFVFLSFVSENYSLSSYNVYREEIQELNNCF